MSEQVQEPSVHRKVRRQAQQLIKSKKRDQRRKGLRLLREASRNIVAERVSADRANANVVAVRRAGNTIFGMRTGLFGHPTTTVLRVPDETIVGAIEDPQELGAMVTQVGMLVMAALFNYNLAFGTEGLAKKMAAWAGIDVEALKREAEKAAEEEAAKVTEEVDEDGDIVVRTAEESVTPIPGDPYMDDMHVDLGGES